MSYRPLVWAVALVDDSTDRDLLVGAWWWRIMRAVDPRKWRYQRLYIFTDEWAARNYLDDDDPEVDFDPRRRPVGVLFKVPGAWSLFRLGDEPHQIAEHRRWCHWLWCRLRGRET